MSTPSATVGQNAWKGDVAIARVYDAPLTAEKVKALWETVKRDQQPATISITDLLYLSGCEVGANYAYTVYGKGLRGDKTSRTVAGSGSPSRSTGRPQRSRFRCASRTDLPRAGTGWC